jgi:hypothetical protein
MYAYKSGPPISYFMGLSIKLTRNRSYLALNEIRGSCKGKLDQGEHSLCLFQDKLPDSAYKSRREPQYSGQDMFHSFYCTSKTFGRQGM